MILSTSIGIELAGRDLRIAVVQSRFGRLRLLRSVEVPGFLDLAVEEQKATLERAVKEHRLTFGRVFLSLPHDRGMVRQMEFPVEVAEKLKAAVALQIESLCPWSADEIYWDFSVESRKKGAKLFRVTIAIVPRAEIDPWMAFFKSIKLPLSGVLLSSVTHAHGVRTLWPNSDCTIVLDCEKGYVEGSLIHGGQLSSVTQTGGEANIAAKDAVERLAASGRVGAAEDVRFVSYGSEAAQLESVEPVILPIENASVGSTVRFGAIASALIGIRRTAFAANLIPSALRYRRSQWQTVPTFVLLALTMLAGIAMLLREPYQMTVYASQIDSEIRRVAPVAREVSKQQTELNNLSDRYRALAGHLQNRDYNLEALQEITRVLPSGAWLVSYSYQDGNIQLSGYADSTSAIQKLLEDSPLFKDVQPTAAVTRDAKGKDKFSLKATIEVSR